MSKKSSRGTPAKRTGKKGITLVNADRPSGKDAAAGEGLDKDKDFDKPLTKPGTPAAEEAKQQGELIQVDDNEKNPAVVGEKIKATYVKPHFDLMKGGDRIVALEVSFPLTEDHDGLLPKKVKQGWDFIKKGYPRLDVDDIAGQKVAFYMTHDDDEEILVLPAAKVSHASLRVVEETGTGAAKEVIRFSFRLGVKLTKEVAHFAEWNYGNIVYMEMADSQEKLFDEEE